MILIKIKSTRVEYKVVFYNLEQKVIVRGGLSHLSLELHVLLRSEAVLLHCGDLPHLAQPGVEVLQSGWRVVELLLWVNQVLLSNVMVKLSVITVSVKETDWSTAVVRDSEVAIMP